LLAHAASLILLAVAVSLDGFGVGVTYGLRRIRIPVISVVIIGLCSGFVVWLSMQIGTLLSAYLSPHTAKVIGACLLVLIGTWALYQLWKRRRNEADEEAAEQPGSAQVQAAAGQVSQEKYETSVEDQKEQAATTIVILELKRLGLVVQILRKPQMADVDRSGTISPSEALLLGFALSLDSFGAGLGAAMIGFSPLLTALVLSTASGLLLLAGMQVGFRFAAWPPMRALSILPGIMLIVMGVMKML
jgi:putative Mn2+ efflux pump MntP